jgi:ATP-binding cassette subfamily F protein 3
VWWYFIISHDREFLDKTCQKTYEMQPKRQIKFYHSNYSWYVDEREKIENKWNINFKRQQEYIKKEETLINRFRAWSRASFAKSREKALNKLDRITPPYIPKKPKFFFNYSEESNERIFYFKQVFIWRKEPLFFINDLSFQKWQRVWIVWENWTWKSTFIKTILWELDILDWLYLKWKWIQTLYYSQLHEELDKEKTVRENFEKNWIFYPDQQLIWYLNHYLIDKSHVDKKVKHLSWWQISKVLFAILWQKESNVLVFDEPTNHLDYDTREALENELNNYKWSILFISHDRYFVNKLATNIWFIENEELSISYWNYEDYLFKQQNWLSMDMSMFQESAELDIVLEEKFWEKEANRIKKKFMWWKKRKK